MKNENPYNTCVECEEVITHPICSECLAREMRAFLQEFDGQLAQEITSTTIDGGTACLRCGQPMGLCAHCFSRDVYEDLVEKNPEAAEEFLGRFDFDLRKVFH